MNKVFSLKIDYNTQKIFDQANDTECYRFNIANSNNLMQILHDKNEKCSYLHPTANCQGIRAPYKQSYTNFGSNDWTYEIQLRALDSGSLVYNTNAILYGNLFRGNCIWISIWSGNILSVGYAYTTDTTGYGVTFGNIPDDGKFHSLITSVRNRMMSVYLDYKLKGTKNVSDRPFQTSTAASWVGFLDAYPHNGAENIYDRTLRADVKSINIYSGVFDKFIINNLKAEEVYSF